MLTHSAKNGSATWIHTTKMVLLDTNILIGFWKQNALMQSQLQAIGETNLCISAVTEAELLVGARDTQDLRMIRRKIAHLPVIPIDPDICTSMAKLLTKFVLSHRLQMPDALIAATALHHDLPLFTLNLKDFRYIPNLRLHQLTPDN